MDDFSIYLPVDRAAMARGFYLTGAGIETIAAGYTAYPVNGHPAMYGFEWESGRVLTAFAVIECRAGRGVVEFKRGRQLPLASGQVILIPPDTWHRYRPARETGWCVAWVKVAGHAVTRAVAAADLPCQPRVLTPPDGPAFQSLFRNLLEAVAASPHSNSPAAAVKALALIGLCVDDFASGTSGPEHGPSTGDKVVDLAIQSIWNHSHRVLDVRLLSESVGVSRRTLELRFRRARGCGILDEINRARLERAEELLANTRIPVSDVVGLSGFGSAEAMRKSFWRYRGRRPSEIRRAGG